MASLHGSYYHEHWSFGVYFEAKVATELASFLTSYVPGRDGFWTVSVDGQIEASIAIDGSDAHGNGAHIRWFIVSDDLRGRGAGGELLGTAMRFCRTRGYPRVCLWTFGGLDAARHLYEREGFVLCEERPGTTWGSEAERVAVHNALPRSIDFGVSSALRSARALRVCVTRGLTSTAGGIVGATGLPGPPSAAYA